MAAESMEVRIAVTVTKKTVLTSSEALRSTSQLPMGGL
jgi:hypothetical protein